MLQRSIGLAPTRGGLRAWCSAVCLFLVLLVTPGCVYTNVKVPLDKDLDKTELGEKVGKSELESVAWLVAWGDAGTEAAAEQGGITTIRHADRQVFSILGGLYYRQTTIVYGD